MTHYLFSYGTLQAEDVQLRLFGRLLTGFRDTLIGHKLIGVEVTDKIFLATGEQSGQQSAVRSIDKTDQIEGTVFEVSEAELFAADRYEPAQYKRSSVVLGSGREAWLYAVGNLI